MAGSVFIFVNFQLILLHFLWVQDLFAGRFLDIFPFIFGIWAFLVRNKSWHHWWVETNTSVIDYVSNMLCLNTVRNRIGLNTVWITNTNFHIEPLKIIIDNRGLWKLNKISTNNYPIYFIYGSIKTPIWLFQKLIAYNGFSIKFCFAVPSLVETRL